MNIDTVNLVTRVFFQLCIIITRLLTLKLVEAVSGLQILLEAMNYDSAHCNYTIVS